MVKYFAAAQEMGLVLLMPEPAHRHNAPKRKKDQQIRKSIGLLSFLLIRFF
jgi:hypothetical protein